MRNFLLSLLSIAAFGANAQNVNIPDPLFKACLVSNTLINTNSDTEIQVSEALAYTGTVKCINNVNLTDITGIEAFVNITGLKIFGNNISAMNISSNVNLQYLVCNHNSNLASLDLSSNTNLISLWANSTNISTLDLSNNTNLDTLEMSSTPLASVNLSNVNLTVFKASNCELTQVNLSLHTNLKKVIVHNNSLSSLNVKNGNNTNMVQFFANGNPNLTCIEVDDVTYSSSNWTNIDASTVFSTNCASVSIDEASHKTDLIIYPNPTRGLVTFSTTEQINKIEVYNLTGQKVAFFNNVNSINISELNEGIYLAKIHCNNNKISTKRIIKK